MSPPGSPPAHFQQPGGAPDAESHTNPVYVYLDNAAPYQQESLDVLVAQLDKISLSGCLPGLTRQPDWLATSDLSRAYKPAAGYFRLLKSQLRIDEPEELLIISAKPQVDLEPADACGYQTLRIDRREEGPAPRSLTDAVALLA